MGVGVYEASSVTGLLTTGGGSALLRKVVFQLEGVGLHGIVHTFEKPYFTTFQSALASTLCLVFFYIIKYWHRLRSRDDDITQEDLRLLSDSHESSHFSDTALEPVLQSFKSTVSSKDPDYVPYHGSMSRLDYLRGKYGKIKRSKWVKLFIPASAGVLALILQGIGLKYVTASISQMVSGSCIVFTAVFSVLILKRRLNWLHNAGIMATLIGVGIVSVSTMFAPTPKGSEESAPSNLMLYGIVITLISQAVQALQLVLEELLLGDLYLHPMQILGYEGIIQMLWMVIVYLPLAQVLPGHDVGGVQENTLDTFMMLGNLNILLVGLVYFVTVIGTLAFGLMVTHCLGSIMRAVLLTTRTALVWLAELMFWYCGLQQFGEPWTWSSWIKLLGFIGVLLGTLLYAQGTLLHEPHPDETNPDVEPDTEEKLDAPESTFGSLPGRRFSSRFVGEIHRTLRHPSAWVMDRAASAYAAPTPFRDPLLPGVPRVSVVLKHPSACPEQNSTQQSDVNFQYAAPKNEGSGPPV